MPADAAGLFGTMYSTTRPSPLARPSCSLTTSGTCDASPPRNVIGTFGAFSWAPGTPGGPCGPGGCGGAGGVCANPAMGKAMAAIVAIDFIFMVLFSTFLFVLLFLIVIVIGSLPFEHEQEQEKISRTLWILQLASIPALYRAHVKFARSLCRRSAGVPF